MRASWKGWGGFGAALLCLSGCWTTQPSLKPPPVPPEYLLPPSDDPRFSEPPVYPDKVLNEGIKHKDTSGTDLGPPSLGGMRPSSGRYGGPGTPGGGPGSGSMY
jgi:hypothetical protein